MLKLQPWEIKQKQWKNSENMFWEDLNENIGLVACTQQKRKKILKSLNLSEMGEMSSVSLGVESETEHVAEWIVLARNPASWRLESLRWIVAKRKTHGGPKYQRK